MVARVRLIVVGPDIARVIEIAGNGAGVIMRIVGDRAGGIAGAGD